jgi:effector-binding domain-containing protein
MEVSFEGPELGVGASYSWKSSVHGNGQMTILESKPYEMVSNELKFMEEEIAYSNFYFEETNGGTKVTWTTDIPKLSYPVERYFGLVMPGMMREFFTSGLENLADVSAELDDPVDVKVIKTQETMVVAILDSCYWKDFEKKMDEVYGELMTFMARNKNVSMAGPHYSMYYKWDEQNQFAVFETGFPVDKEVRSRGRVKFKVLPASKAVTASHFGSYDDLAISYLALEEYVKEFGLEEKCCPYEAYITNPMTQPDTTKWQTDVFFLIK